MNKVITWTMEMDSILLIFQLFKNILSRQLSSSSLVRTTNRSAGRNQKFIFISWFDKIMEYSKLNIRCFWLDYIKLHISSINVSVFSRHMSYIWKRCYTCKKSSSKEILWCSRFNACRTSEVTRFLLCQR